MFASFTVAQVKRDKCNEVVRFYEDDVIPASKSQKGFRGAYLFIDRKTGKGVSIALWDRREDAVAVERNGFYQQQVERLTDFFTVAPVREVYEVIYKTMFRRGISSLSI